MRVIRRGLVMETGPKVCGLYEKVEQEGFKTGGFLTSSDFQFLETTKCEPMTLSRHNTETTLIATEVVSSVGVLMPLVSNLCPPSPLLQKSRHIFDTRDEGLSSVTNGILPNSDPLGTRRKPPSEDRSLTLVVIQYQCCSVNKVLFLMKRYLKKMSTRGLKIFV